MKNHLEEMFKQQHEFMLLLQKHRNFPEFPVDTSSKDGQKLCKTIAYDAMGELFEVIQELKHSKDHRKTDLSDQFDRSKVIEELVDCMHYFVELCLLLDVDWKEFHQQYMAKGNVNFDRINRGY